MSSLSNFLPEKYKKHISSYLKFAAAGGLLGGAFCVVRSALLSNTMPAFMAEQLYNYHRDYLEQLRSISFLSGRSGVCNEQDCIDRFGIISQHQNSFYYKPDNFIEKFQEFFDARLDQSEFSYENFYFIGYESIKLMVRTFILQGLKISITSDKTEIRLDTLLSKLNSYDDFFYFFIRAFALRHITAGAILIPIVIFTYRCLLDFKSYLILTGWIKPSVTTELERSFIEIREAFEQNSRDMNRKTTVIQEALADINASKIHSLANSVDNHSAINEYLCPILHTVMRYPVKSADGFYFEKSALVEWHRKGNQRCVFNRNLTLTNPNNLEIDTSLQLTIVRFLENHHYTETQKRNY